MAPLSKNQQTISSFFRKTPSSPVKPVVTDTIVSNREDDDIILPNPKRRRLSRDSDLQDGSIDKDNAVVDTQTTLKDVAGNGQKSRITPAGDSRTSKYLFTLPSQQENIIEDEIDEVNQRKREELHRQFVRKLGRPDSITEIKRRNRALFDEANQDHDNEDVDDQPEEEAPKSARSRTVKKVEKKLTPMEKQVIEIKRANMDTLLVVEVGYKFRFFGEDARIASKELSIVCIPGKMRFDEHPSEAHLDRFASASIPVHRLHVHVKRLVSAGHKVGVVRQLETAALKAVGDNRNAPFIRKLTNLYTKGTYIDDTEGLDEEGISAQPRSPSTGYLLCLTEVNSKGYGNDEKVHVGIVAVQPCTGDVIYDDFEDGFMRSEIETRLLHIAPCEFIVVGDLSKASEKLVQHLSSSKTNVFGDKIRVERVSKTKTTAAESYSHISNFYADKLKELPMEDGKASKIFSKVLELPEHVTVCLSAMIHHMSDYGLEHVFDLTKYFQPFSARSHMLLNGNTLTSLEIYQNQTDYSSRGSLFWTLDRTQTKFGGRLLRKWVGRPLLQRQEIEQRLVAVGELMDVQKTSHVEKLRQVMSKIRTDLEKSLIRIYYGKCTRPELLSVLQSLQYLSTEFGHITTAETTGFASPLITSAMILLPSIHEAVVSYLERINREAAKSDDKYEFFREAFETDKITEHRFGIASIEKDLDDFRAAAAEKLGRKKPIDYTSVAGIDYLIEVENSSATIKKVPASWIKISGTKKVSRFHPPELVKLTRERDQHKESLAAACDEAFKGLLEEISSKYQLFRDAIQALALLDCLLSLATVASQPGYIKPTFSDDTRIDIKGARHPMIEQLLLDAYVPNDILLSRKDARALLVTGPNMGGKSSFVRSVALIAIMAQIGSFVPAASAHLGITDAVFTRMGAFDNMMSGESTFMVELSETSDILKLATERSLVVLDELGRGTSTHDGVAIAGSVLDWLVREKRCMTLFITHYQVLARMADGWPNGELKNVHMRFTEEEASDNITFLYEVGEGVAHRSYGLNVARLANVGEGVINVAREKSSELEQKTRVRQMSALGRLLTDHSDKMFDHLDAVVESIEQL